MIFWLPRLKSRKLPYGYKTSNIKLLDLVIQILRIGEYNRYFLEQKPYQLNYKNSMEGNVITLHLVYIVSQGILDVMMMELGRIILMKSLQHSYILLFVIYTLETTPYDV